MPTQLHLTPTLEAAIEKAALLHDGQYRKAGNEPPYVSHLVSVAMMLAAHTGDETIVVAGLLHDSLEDTPYTPDELEAEFGIDVAGLVAIVTEPKEVGGVPVPWRERKEAYLSQLREGDQRALLISLADKIHNLRSAIKAHEKNGTNVWDAFSAGAEAQLWFHGALIELARERLGEHSLVLECETVYTEAQQVFTA